MLMCVLALSAFSPLSFLFSLDAVGFSNEMKMWPQNKRPTIIVAPAETVVHQSSAVHLQSIFTVCPLLTSRERNRQQPHLFSTSFTLYIQDDGQRL